jgi:hypothetical protein
MAGTKSRDKSSNDNRSRQLNPENDAYWRSRGEPARPDGAGTNPARPGGRSEGGLRPAGAGARAGRNSPLGLGVLPPS